MQYQGITLKKLALFFHPIKRKTKTNRNSFVEVFPRFASAACFYVKFWLVPWIVSVLWDWLEWFWFYDTQFKTALSFRHQAAGNGNKQNNQPGDTVLKYQICKANRRFRCYRQHSKSKAELDFSVSQLLLGGAHGSLVAWNSAGLNSCVMKQGQNDLNFQCRCPRFVCTMRTVPATELLYEGACPLFTHLQHVS